MFAVVVISAKFASRRVVMLLSRRLSNQTPVATVSPNLLLSYF